MEGGARMKLSTGDLISEGTSTTLEDVMNSAETRSRQFHVGRILPTSTPITPSTGAQENDEATLKAGTRTSIPHVLSGDSFEPQPHMSG